LRIGALNKIFKRMKGKFTMFKHKKTAAFILAAALCASLTAAPAYSVFAEDSTEAVSAADEEELFASGSYKYSIASDGKVRIEEYTGSEKDVVIPDTLDGKAVAEIGGEAFYDTNAVSVRIPAGVNYIDGNPFLDSYSLKEIIVDDKNETYYSEDGVLYLSRAGKITLMAYPQGKTESSFTVPDNVDEIGVAAIYGTQLAELNISSKVSYVYRHAFSYNSKLTKLDMSACTGLDALGDMAAAGCSALTDLQLPPMLKEINAGSFASCSALAQVDLPETLEKVGQNAFAATAMKSVRIPESVTKLEYCAFGYDENLNPIEDFVVIGKPGSAAQTYCTDADEDYDYKNDFQFLDVSSADLLDDASTFETKTFGEYMYTEKDGGIYILTCSAVTPTIEIPDEIDGKPVTCIYSAAFYQNNASKIVIPDTVSKIGEAAFVNCENLTDLELPPSLKELGNQALAGCIKLEKIEIPESCEIIGDEAFYGCTGIKEFGIKGNSQYFTAEDGVLYNSDKTAVIAYPPKKTDEYYKAPESVSEIKISAFTGNEYLETVDISTVTAVGDYAFENCSKLSSVKFSENIDTIGTCAFYNCNNLKAVRLYNNITEIGAASIGYYYDPNDTENDGDVLVEGFIIYAEENSGGANYAAMNEIQCENDVTKYTDAKAPRATIKIFGYKVEKTFFYVVIGIISAAVLAAAGVITGKAVKKKKRNKSIEELKKSAENKLSKRSESDGGKDDKNEVK